MILFYADRMEGNTAWLEEGEALHCRQVLRKRVGEKIVFTDGKGRAFRGTITRLDKKEVEVERTEDISLEKPREFAIHIGIAPTKNINRLEWFLEKATELGIDEITPILCRRSERKVVKEDRLEKILISAMKQSLKTSLPVLHPLTPFDHFISQQKDGQRFIAHLNELSVPLMGEIRAGESITVLIGPEGDFQPDEIRMAEREGYIPVSLGDYRLRTETAGISAVQLVHFVNALKGTEKSEPI